MRWRVLALVTVIYIASASAFAQKANDVKSRAEQILRAWETAFNKRDGAGIGALLTKDAVFVTPAGVVIEGRDKIQQGQEQVMKNFGDFTAKLTLEKVVAVGDGGWSIGRTVITHAGKEDRFHWAGAYAPEGGQLKVKMLTLGVDVQPPPPAK